MSALDYARAQLEAERLHAGAKDGTLTLEGVRYTLTFDRYAGVYVVTDPEGLEIVRFNTRKLTVARQWLREALS